MEHLEYAPIYLAKNVDFYFLIQKFKEHKKKFILLAFTWYNVKALGSPNLNVALKYV